MSFEKKGIPCDHFLSLTEKKITIIVKMLLKKF